jgi:hypothetical protein
VFWSIRPVNRIINSEFHNCAALGVTWDEGIHELFVGGGDWNDVEAIALYPSNGMGDGRLIQQ